MTTPYQCCGAGGEKDSGEDVDKRSEGLHIAADEMGFIFHTHSDLLWQPKLWTSIIHLLGCR